MANRVAWLSKRVKIGGQWFVRKPIIKTSGFVTEKVEHNGQSVHAPGTFVLEWYENGERQRKPLTESTLEAQDALRKKTQTLEARSNGLTVVEDQGAKGQVSLETAVREYLEEVKLNRAHKTHLAYKRALGMLVAANPSCDFVQDLERRNLMVHFIRAMKEAGLGDRTQNNLFGAVVTFLHANQHPVVTRKDAPDYTETEIETYSALRRRHLKAPVELGYVALAQKLIRLLHRSTSSQPQLLRQPPLPGAEAAFAAAPRLRRVRRDHLHSQLVQRPPHLGSTLVVHLAADLRRQPEMAAPIAVQGAEHTFALDHFPQPRHHRQRRFLFHQLRVINLAGGVVQNHDQVVPALVLQPLMPAAVDVQQHPRQRPPRTPLAVNSALAPARHQPGSLQRLLHPRVAQFDAVLGFQLLVKMLLHSCRNTSPGKVPVPSLPPPAAPAAARPSPAAGPSTRYIPLPRSAPANAACADH